MTRREKELSAIVDERAAVVRQCIRDGKAVLAELATHSLWRAAVRLRRAQISAMKARCTAKERRQTLREYGLVYTKDGWQ